MADEDAHIDVIDAREMALVVTVDAKGFSRFSSGLGYTKRQQADMLRTLADTADRRADEAGEAARPPSRLTRRRWGRPL